MATSSAHREDAARIIREMDRQFLANLKAKNAARLVDDFYADEARLLPPGQPAVVGKAAIRQLWEGLLGSIESLALESTQIEVSGDLAYAVGNHVASMKDADGTVTQSTGKYCVVYRRQGNRWRAVVDMFSSDS